MKTLTTTLEFQKETKNYIKFDEVETKDHHIKGGLYISKDDLKSLNYDNNSKIKLIIEV